MHIISGVRTPLGAFQGVFKDIKAPDLGGIALKSARGDVLPEHIDEVIMGCVLSAGVGQAPARQACLKSGQPYSTPAFTLNKVCGSGMKAVMLASDRIALGESHLVLAGGMESMTNAPYLLAKARSGYRFGHSELLDHMSLDGLEDAYEQRTAMGLLAEKLASDEHFTREAQDAFALLSLDRALKSLDIFSKEITPVGEVTRDESPSKGRPEKIPLLKPAFKKEGTITAASASGIADGAAALLLGSDAALSKYGLKSRAKIVGQSQFSCAPEDFTKAPVGAIQKLLEKLDWRAKDVDLFEVNEAFAVVPMYAMKMFDIPADKMNIHGGACSLGHPIGMSGARVIVTLLNALEHHNLKRGIAAVCIGGGEGLAIALERHT
jgi:acetyl-CoA C-acetyltransferase